MKKVLLSITAWGIILFFGMTTANAQTTQDIARKDIAKRGLASTVSLIMDNDDYGSGFFVLPDQIATAYHVVEGASSGYVSPVHQENKYPIVGITAIDKDNDLVILKVSGAHGIPLQSDDNKVDILDQVIVVGNPLGYEGTVEDGRIINNSLGNLLLTDVAINRGNSGGPLLSIPGGEVIGVAIAKPVDIAPLENVPELVNIADGLGIIVPSKYLIPLVEKARSGKEGLKPLSVDGVTGTHLAWGRYTYTFTLHNQRNETIYNPHLLLIFKDDRGVICMDQFKMPNIFLFAGQVKREIRITNTDLLLSGRYNRLLNAPSDRHTNISLVGPRVRQLMKSYEIRILDFDIEPHITRGLWGTLAPLEGVTGSGFTWFQEGYVWKGTYSLHNQLSQEVKDVMCYVVFYDKEGAPIAESIGDHNLKIPAKGTVQVEEMIISDSDNVKQLTKRVEYRIYQAKYGE